MAGNKLNAYERIVENIRMSGKEDLYSELVYALKFGASRKHSFYSCSIFIEHGVAIFEDFLITLADGIAGTYLELISVDCRNDIDDLGLSLCTLSTRALQKLRNEVALQRWFHRNTDAVVCMFEDQFEVCILESHPTEECSSRRSKTKKFGWWINNSSSRSPENSRCRAAIKNVRIPVRRTRELRGLTGWRYCFSVLLEVGDIGIPFLRSFIGRASDGISFVLVGLIGRWLGLVVSGIRNCLRLQGK
ncbi:hypothetical protein M569_15240 [Genlisea aurea]|uniref:Uncharacterized protein n=1 Tax=Genlisea aurea TaxID=192259 RepID=S8DJA1_9LAMI|nr:hypothetical protein M569_15240 [Genlisea aurea]